MDSLLSNWKVLWSSRILVNKFYGYESGCVPCALPGVLSMCSHSLQVATILGSNHYRDSENMMQFDLPISVKHEFYRLNEGKVNVPMGIILLQKLNNTFVR